MASIEAFWSDNFVSAPSNKLFVCLFREHVSSLLFVSSVSCFFLFSTGFCFFFFGRGLCYIKCVASG